MTASLPTMLNRNAADDVEKRRLAASCQKHGEQVRRLNGCPDSPQVAGLSEIWPSCQGRISRGVDKPPGVDQ
jgi:hypothetical protein